VRVSVLSGAAAELVEPEQRGLSVLRARVSTVLL